MDDMDGLDEIDEEARAAYVRQHMAGCLARLRARRHEKRAEEKRARDRRDAAPRRADDAQPDADAGPTWQRGRRENEAANDVRFLAEVRKQVGEPFTIGGAAAALGYDRSSASRRILRLLAAGTVTREYALNDRKRGAWVYRAAAVGCDVTGVTDNVRGATC